MQRRSSRLDWMAHEPPASSSPLNDPFFASTKGPSLSYERKLRLLKYAENRATSCLGMLSDSSAILWKHHDSKHDVALFKPSSDWSEFATAKAVVKATASFPSVLKMIYELRSSDKFKIFMRKVLGDMFLDAEVLEDLSDLHRHTKTAYRYGSKRRGSAATPAKASIKWWAIKSGPLSSKSTDFYVLECLGVEFVGNEIVSCYFFQESLAEVGGLPHIHGNNLERSHFDALICKFERLPPSDHTEKDIRISIAFQRPQSMMPRLRGNPAMDMVLLFARGLRNLLEDPHDQQDITVVKTSSWVNDRDRPFCNICTRKFHPLIRRRHHCRTCGEVICWKCSSTLRVSSISFTHNGTGKQVLSRHQPSIRVCIKCIMANHDARKDEQHENQSDLNQWITRNIKGEGGEEDQEEGEDEEQENEPVARHSDPEVSSQVSHSFSQDLSGLYDDGESVVRPERRRRGRRRGGHDPVVNRLSRNRRSLESEVGEEEESRYSRLGLSKHTRLSSKGPQAAANHVSFKKKDSRLHNNQQYEVPKRRQEETSNQYEDEELSYDDYEEEKDAVESPVIAKEMFHFQPEYIGEEGETQRRSNHMRRVKRSQSELDILRAVKQSTGSRPQPHIQPHPKRDHNNISRGSSRRRGSTATVTSNASSLNKYLLPGSSTSTCVLAASAWGTHATEAEAVRLAFQELMMKLNGSVHFMVVGFSTGFQADLLVETLSELAPNVPYVGGTLARGMCDENSWVAVNHRSGEGLVSLWGINDPSGVYAVVHAEYADGNAKHQTATAVTEALERVSVEVNPGETPAFLLLYACPLFVEGAIEGIREVLHCPVLGGCSADAPKTAGEEESVSWVQISSSTGQESRHSHHHSHPPHHYTAASPHFTSMGMAIALCYPSVETAVSWFSGYTPLSLGRELFCMGTVTRASTKVIHEIDARPAADVYREWLDVASEKSQTDLRAVGFPRVGNLHPLGTTMDLSSNQVDSEVFYAESTSTMCSMKSNDWSKLINMTAVITGINEHDGSLCTTSTIPVGTTVTLMETSTASLKLAINKMGTQVIEGNKFHIHETIGCLMFLSAGVQALLGHTSMAEMVGAYRSWSGGASLIGMTTFGEIGHLPNGTDDPHYDSLMFGALIFSKRKRKRPVYHL